MSCRGNAGYFPKKGCCQYSIPPDYSKYIDKTQGPYIEPVSQNPGQLQFFAYDYIHQTADGKSIQAQGRGWQEYNKTGRYYRSW